MENTTTQTNNAYTTALSNSKLTVLSNGNVGIGTTTPSKKLEVNGDVLITGNLLATQHSFLASHSVGGNVILGVHVTFKPTSIPFNYGNCYSPSTGRFTAKIKGVYCFKFSAYTNQGNSTSRPGIIKNGSSYMFGGGTVYRSGNQIDSIVVLEINDWVEIQSIQGGLYFYSAGSHNQFCGHLVAAL